MPSKSKKQAKTARAACKSKAFSKKIGWSQKSACEFMRADQRKAKGRKR